MAEILNISNLLFCCKIFHHFHKMFYSLAIQYNKITYEKLHFSLYDFFGTPCVLLPNVRSQSHLFVRLLY